MEVIRAKCFRYDAAPWPTPPGYRHRGDSVTLLCASPIRVGCILVPDREQEKDGLRVLQCEPIGGSVPQAWRCRVDPPIGKAKGWKLPSGTQLTVRPPLFQPGYPDPDQSTCTPVTMRTGTSYREVTRVAVRNVPAVEGALPKVAGVFQHCDRKTHPGRIYGKKKP